MAFKNPSLTTDAVIIQNKHVLLVKRKNDPFKGKWALPGGFVEYGETTENAVIREVLEETSLKTRIQRLVGVYSDPERDPRGHTITIVYQLDIIAGSEKAGDDAAAVSFFPLQNLPELSFDHEKIINDAVGD